MIYLSCCLLADLGAGVAQLVEQLICNQQVGGSSPSTSSIFPKQPIEYVGEFPSGQRGQTVNLLSMTSMVRIHPLPPIKKAPDGCFFYWSDGCFEESSGSSKQPQDRVRHCGLPESAARRFCRNGSEPSAQTESAPYPSSPTKQERPTFMGCTVKDRKRKHVIFVLPFNFVSHHNKQGKCTAQFSIIKRP